MKKLPIIIYIILCALLFPVIVNALDNNILSDTTKHKEKWHWGFYLSGDHCNRYFNNYDKSKLYLVNEVKYLDSITIPMYGNTTGITSEKHFKNHFSFQTGLLIRNYNLSTKLIPRSWSNPYFIRCYAIYGSVPFKIKYYITYNKESNFYTDIGIAPCFKIYGKLIDFDENEKPRRLSHDENQNYSVPILESNFNIGICYNFKKVKFTTSFFIHYSLIGNEINILIYRSLYSEHIYSIGVATNLIF